MVGSPSSVCGGTTETGKSHTRSRGRRRLVLRGRSILVDRWFDTSVFSTPELYTYGNGGRNTVIGPGYRNSTLGLYKNFFIKERHRIQFRMEFFNAFNNVNLNNPDTNFQSGNIGRISSSDPARQIQFGLKYSF